MGKSCFHCGIEFENESFVVDQKDFCCIGCKTVYEILSEHELHSYYDIEKNPGISPLQFVGKFDYLDNKDISDQLLEFDENGIQIVNLFIPNIHCSSCIWVLEQANKLNLHIKDAQVTFPKKTVRLVYNSSSLSLKELVVLLASIGYPPKINLENKNTEKQVTDRSLLYKIGVAGFSFGNVMLLSFPEYFEVSEFWLDQYKPVFRWLMFAFSLPVVFYAASDYFISAYKSLKKGILNIDLPIALGVFVLFTRSTYEIIAHTGQGFFDSLTGLLFFLLVGRYFQQKTYAFLSFERSYKSYFPIGVTVIKDGMEENIQVKDVKKGDRILIRNEEIIPVDSILMKGNAEIDYSFVTGESNPIHKALGDKIYAGGKQKDQPIEIQAIRSVSQSYLTQLWSKDSMKNQEKSQDFALTNKISKYFTLVILIVAFSTLGFWLWWDPGYAAYVFSAVLIIACPCALALAEPFTLGNLLRIYGKRGFYLKNGQVINRMAEISSIIFDKTGTITANDQSKIHYHGMELNTHEQALLKSTLRGSNHPLSRQLYNMLRSQNILTMDDFKETAGKGIEATFEKDTIKVGSASFLNHKAATKVENTSVHISTNNNYKGKFVLQNMYREGVFELFKNLSKHYEIAILSGDNAQEEENLTKRSPSGTKMFFNQKPEDKYNYIKDHQKEGSKMLMIGDGLNDAGALKESHVGIAVSENVNVFSPACDAILDASKLKDLDKYLRLSKMGVHIIHLSFVISFLYNVIGLSFAVTGNLSPVVAAILMPLSSISIVAFTTLSTYYVSRKLT
ncbi:heavy metal translocating P-type ATPase [Galbibacter marinus]|uniref:Heavy metal translocating P-type ATPase n=1 Tax=Galbibacter marinus TaxID=555500 RepID=K2PSP1_9FLAO|nr:heavy metal translocating P-type ATPase metal-binding domain-containing protein [Galbibacter marinus]EKF54589.1 heavy metal translocating P-type ATPase [Galbibacter marinus]